MIIATSFDRRFIDMINDKFETQIFDITYLNRKRFEFLRIRNIRKNAINEKQKHCVIVVKIDEKKQSSRKKTFRN